MGRVSPVIGRQQKSAVREYVETVVGAVLLAVFIMVFVARAFTVDGLSMHPTLHNGERLLVDKLSYRFRQPQRGEIVVFRYPADPSEHFIKRVIGVPGDTVEVHDGRLLVNGVAPSELYLSEPTFGQFNAAVVPVGHYFVMGDNRNNSEDSRDDRVGFVPANLIVGRALWRFWPLTRIGLLNRPQEWVEQDNRVPKAADSSIGSVGSVGSVATAPRTASGGIAGR